MSTEITRRGFLGLLLSGVAIATFPLPTILTAEPCPLPYGDDFIIKKVLQLPLTEDGFETALMEQFDEGFNANVAYLNPVHVKEEFLHIDGSPFARYESNFGRFALFTWAQVPRNQVWLREKGFTNRQAEEMQQEGVRQDMVTSGYRE